LGLVWLQILNKGAKMLVNMGRLASGVLPFVLGWLVW